MMRREHKERTESFPLDLVLTAMHGALFPVRMHELADLLEFVLQRSFKNEADANEMASALFDASQVLRKQLPKLFTDTKPSNKDKKEPQVWRARQNQLHGVSVTVRGR